MKIGLVSLGCPKNLVDSEVMLGLAQQAGYELTNDAAGADVLVVNTCAFIDSAKQESIDTILGTGEVPEIVGAIGGAAVGAPLQFFRAAPGTLAPGTVASSTPAPGVLPTYIYDADTPRYLATPKHYAYVKIAEGCD